MNDYAVTSARVEVACGGVDNDNHELWFIVLCSVVGLLFSLLIIFIFFTVCTRGNYKLRLASSQSQVGILENELPEKRSKPKKPHHRTEEFAILDEAIIKEMLGTKKH